MWKCENVANVELLILRFWDFFDDILLKPRFADK
jgi:hypothetical protein